MEINFRNEMGLNGRGKIVWDTRDFNSGTYIYTFKSGKFNVNGKILISK